MGIKFGKSSQAVQTNDKNELSTSIKPNPSIPMNNPNCKQTTNQSEEIYIELDPDAPEELLVPPHLQQIRDEVREARIKEQINTPVSRHEAEADKGLAPVRQFQQQQEYERDKKVKGGRAKRKEERQTKAVNPMECFNWGIKELERLGITELLHSRSSLLPGKVEFAYAAQLPDRAKKGLFIPITNNKTYKTIAANNSKINGKTIVEYLLAEMNDENGTYLDYKQQWLDYFANTPSRESKLVKILEGYEMDSIRTRSISGLHTAHKRIFPLSWFAERIRNIKAEDILALWNKPEQEVLMLLLGKALVGASYERMHNDHREVDTVRILEKFENPNTGDIIQGGIHHTARSIGVLCGSAGLGKTFFVGKLKDALNLMGFTSSIIPLSGNQFNWGVAETNDILFSDDTTTDDFKKLFNSSQIKTIASNGTYPLEDKGINARPARATTSLFICTNHVQINANSDDGAMSRFEFLQTKEELQVKQELGMSYDEHIQELARKNNTSVEVLFAYLFRLCVDKFIDAIGYEYVADEDTYYLNKKPRIKEIITTARQFYLYQGRGDTEGLMTQAAVKVQVVNDWLKNNNYLPVEKQFLNPNEDSNRSFTVSHSLHVAEFVSEVYGRIRACYKDENSNELKQIGTKGELARYVETMGNVLDWVLPRKYFDHQSVSKFASTILKQASENPHDVNPYKLWKSNIEFFGAANGYDPSDNRKFYLQKFNTALSQKDSFYSALNSMLSANKDEFVPKHLAKHVPKFKNFNKAIPKQVLEATESKAIEKQEKDIAKAAARQRVKTKTVTNIDDKAV